MAGGSGGNVAGGCCVCGGLEGGMQGGTSRGVQEVCVNRTEGQVFRERMGFVILCIIGVYCSMRILIELKSILEPFLWALFLVMVWKPFVDAVEMHIERALQPVAFSKNGPTLHNRVAVRNMADEDADELRSLVGDVDDSDEQPRLVCRQRSKPRNACADIDGRSRGGDLNGLMLSPLSRWRKFVARGLAVLMALCGTLGVFMAFGFLIFESARYMQSHFEVYQKGAHLLSEGALHLFGNIFQRMPEQFRLQYVTVTTDMVTGAQNFLYLTLGSFLNNVSNLLLGWLLTLLYTLFWLCSPVPMDSSIDNMFRRYLMFKTLACFGYGVCVGILLSFLSVDLASIFALLNFLLNYVPEVGPFVAMVLPCPVILLDSRLERPFLVLLTALLGQLALKFAFSSIIEVHLIQTDRKLRMHPVMILLSVGIFGYLWGPTGMLLSVPMMALVKVSLFSTSVPASYRDPILVLLEGDRDAPLKHGLCQPGRGPAPGG